MARGSLQKLSMEKRREIARLGADAARRERAFTIYCGHWVKRKSWLVGKLRAQFEREAMRAVEAPAQAS